MTLVESITKVKADYNNAIDATIASINATRSATNASIDIAADQITKVANDFPASLVVPAAPTPAPGS